MLEAIWNYRHFVLASISAEFRNRFARARLGFLWSLLHPLAQAAIFALVLSEVIGARFGGVEDKTAYPVYLLGGMAAWGLFSEILNRCLTIFIEYAGPMKKIAFPRACLPFIVLGGAMINHVLLLAAVAVVFLFLGHSPGTAWLALPLGFVLIAFFAFGLGIVLGVLNVFSRDIGQVMTVIMQVWFWLTPIVYSLEMLPEHIRWIVALNPMAPLVNIYQQAFLYDSFPDPLSLLIPTTLAFGFAALSLMVFRRGSPDMVDVL